MRSPQAATLTAQSHSRIRQVGRCALYAGTLFLLSLAISADPAWSAEDALGAHCFCKATLKEHRTTNPTDFVPLANVQNLAEGKFTIPGWEKSQLWDWGASAAQKRGSCWSECRRAFGVDNNGNISAEASSLKTFLLNQAKAKGQPTNWCGGWLSARLQYAAGTNKYRDATTELIGLGSRLCSSCKCVHGGNVAGPNCSIPTHFKNPEVIPGINYWVDTNPQFPGVYYKQMGGKCPFGGTPAGPNCQLRPFPANFVRPGVYYWVDSNPRWPGVYYKQVQGQCPYGGSTAGPNCTITSFVLPDHYVIKGVDYGVASDPRWPGVYYEPVQGGCPFGGRGPGPNCQVQAFPPGVLKPGVKYWVDADPRWPGVFYAKVCG